MKSSYGGARVALNRQGRSNAVGAEGQRTRGGGKENRTKEQKTEKTWTPEGETTAALGAAGAGIVLSGESMGRRGGDPCARSFLLPATDRRAGHFFPPFLLFYSPNERFFFFSLRT